MTTLHTSLPKEFNNIRVPQSMCSERVVGFDNVYVIYFQFLKPYLAIIRFVIPVVFIIKIDLSVCTCLTQLYLMVEICIEFIT